MARLSRTLYCSSRKNEPKLLWILGPHHSVKMRPAEFFDELDAAFATADGIEDLPEEWDLVVRPTIAHCESPHDFFRISN